MDSKDSIIKGWSVYINNRFIQISHISEIIKRFQFPMQNAHDNGCILFQNRFHLFIVQASFFHFASCLFAEIAFFAVQITKGKLKFRKIENMQLWHFVSFLTKKWNPLNLYNYSSILSNVPEACPKHFNIVWPLEMVCFVSFRHRTKWCLTFFSVYINFVRNIKSRRLPVKCNLT